MVDDHPPNNAGAGPGTGNPRSDQTGGSPLDVRDGTLRPRVDDRAGEPNPGLSAEGVSPNAIHSTVTPSSTRTGWAGGGMALPALLVVVLLVALMALFL